MNADIFQQLLRRVRAGEEDAVRTFLDEFRSDLHRELRMLLTDPAILRVHSLSDLIQSIFLDFHLRLLAGQFEFESPGEVVACLRVLALNKVRHVVRKEKAGRRDVRRLSPGGVQNLESLASDASSPLKVIVSRDLFHTLLDRLPAELRPVAAGRASGHTWAELAAERGVNPEALRKQFDRAMDEVMDLLHPENLEP